MFKFLTGLFLGIFTGSVICVTLMASMSKDEIIDIKNILDANI